MKTTIVSKDAITWEFRQPNSGEHIRVVDTKANFSELTNAEKRQQIYDTEICRLNPLKIYVASSWRNIFQPEAVLALREETGHKVYDFKNPPSKTDFSWRDINPRFKSLPPQEMSSLLSHPIAQAAFTSDKQALDDSDLTILVLPSGRSASWEYGYFTAKNNSPGIVYSPVPTEPELMYSGSRFAFDIPSLLSQVAGFAQNFHSRLLK